MGKPIRKAVIAAAGYGTRFLPQTKAMPKEMLPIVDKPIIQYVVEELVDAGITDIIIVTGYAKRAIEDHFDYPNHGLMNNLRQSGKDKEIKEIEAIANLANFIYIRQKGPQGNATPILNAEHVIGDEPFIYAFADDFVSAEPSRFKQLIEVYQKMGGGNVLTCVRSSDYAKYGFVGGQSLGPNVFEISRIVEKPGSKEQSPSDVASVGGYILGPEIFEYLHRQKGETPSGQEFVQQVSMQRMMEDGHKFYGCLVRNGQFRDTGNKLEYLKTVVDFALINGELKDDFADYLRGLTL